MNNQSEKYGRTYHYPFSPGTTSDDRINANWWQDIANISSLIHTEKLDGENNCLNRQGVFARSHGAVTQSAWTQQIRQRWQLIRHDLHDIELFGENLYAIHSIEYQHIEDYFFVFAVRHQGYWLSFEEVKFYAALFDFPTVPEIILPRLNTPDQYSQQIIQTAQHDSQFKARDTKTLQMCSMEGIVSRNAQAFPVSTFSHNVFKYVRKDHVKTDIHWKRHWQRALLHVERQAMENQPSTQKNNKAEFNG